MPQPTNAPYFIPLEAGSDTPRTRLSAHNLPQRCARAKMLKRHSTSVASNGIHTRIMRAFCANPPNYCGYVRDYSTTGALVVAAGVLVAVDVATVVDATMLVFRPSSASFRTSSVLAARITAWKLFSASPYSPASNF